MSSEPNRDELVAMLRERIAWSEGHDLGTAHLELFNARALLKLIDRPDPAPVTTSREFGEAVFALHSLDKPPPVAAPDLAGLAAMLKREVHLIDRTDNPIAAISAQDSRALLAALEWVAGQIEDLRGTCRMALDQIEFNADERKRGWCAKFLRSELERVLAPGEAGEKENDHVK